MGKKRDRWDSSSEDDDDDKSNAQTVANKKSPQDDAPTTNGVSRSTDSPQHPLHNPLLQGCRSVYRTHDRIARLSEGTYGVVWKAKDLATNQIVALKQIKFDTDIQDQQGFPVTALREINVLLALKHENIVTVQEMVVGSDVNQVFMVMEFFHCDLKEAMDKRTYPNVLRQGELKGIMQQILKGMHHMHSHWYFHRDMKTSNILVHQSGRVALCDLGLARRFQDPPVRYTQLVVTLWYRAPELLFGEERYTPAVDVWSIGCIFGELIQQDAMMQGQGELDQIDKIFTMVGPPTEENWPDFGQLPSGKMFKWRSAEGQKTTQLRELFPVNPPPHLKKTFLDANGFDLLSKLLTLNPKTRITAKQALEHPYFREGVSPTLPYFFDDV
jgi:cell division cycle 2-like protein